jgi:NLI interacting factor-like phosphatase
MMESDVKVKVLALDLEGTLISNAVSQIARPGLFDFLEDCRVLFPRIVIFTSVNEERFRAIAMLLTIEGYAPNWFADIEYITWTGETKNLNYIDGVSPEEILLVDDYEKYVHPGQAGQWIKAPDFDYPYSDDDQGLREVLQLLRMRVASSVKNPPLT